MPDLQTKACNRRPFSLEGTPIQALKFMLFENPEHFTNGRFFKPDNKQTMSAWLVSLRGTGDFAAPEQEFRLLRELASSLRSVLDDIGQQELQKDEWRYIKPEVFSAAVEAHIEQHLGVCQEPALAEELARSLRDLLGAVRY